MEDKLFKIGYTILVVTCLWIAITSTIQRFKCVKMSETELFLGIPNSFMLDFKICK
jgi:hypothetical protein